MTATKKQLARWAALKNRRDRLEQGLFLAEGRKIADEVRAAGWTIEALLARGEAADAYAVTAEQMERVSGFRAPADVLAVVKLPPAADPRWPGGVAWLLDGVQDPGNLGTILRTAAWFGVGTVYCSAGGVDPWHPKVVQASMGAFLRVRCPVVDPVALVGALPATVTVLGTFLDGDSLFEAPLPAEALVVLGNEGHGISPALEARIARRLTVPRYAATESLNVAAVAALVGAEFRRRMV